MSYRAGRIRRALERMTWPIRDRYESEFDGVNMRDGTFEETEAKAAGEKETLVVME